MILFIVLIMYFVFDYYNFHSGYIIEI